MAGSVNPQLQEQATAMFAEILNLPADGAKVVDTFVDYENRDLGIDFDIPVDHFLDQQVGRVTVRAVLPQTNFYNGTPNNLTAPAVITINVPDNRNFGRRNQPYGALEIAAGKITANVAAFAGKGENKVLVSHNSSEHADALAALMERLLAASGAEARLPNR